MHAAELQFYSSDPVLGRVKRDMISLYGDRFEKLILYGSRARGDHRPDSNYNFVVVIKGDYNAWEEIKRISPITSPYIYPEGIDLSVKPVNAHELDERTVLMWEVRQDGIDV